MDKVWNDYLVIGLAVALLLNMLDFSRDSFYQVIPVLVLFFMTGFTDNIKGLWAFIKRYWIVLGIACIHIVYFLLVARSGSSARLIVSMLFVSFAGYLIGMQPDEEQLIAYKKLWVMLLAVILIGISKMLVDDQVGYFTNYSVELAVAVILAVLSVIYLDGAIIKSVGVIVSLCSVILTLKNNALSLNSIIAIKNILPLYATGHIKDIVFGRGLLAAHSAAVDFSENTFASILYDYGLIMFGVYLAIIVFVIKTIIKRNERETLVFKQAVMVIAIVALSTIYSMQYWGSISFLIWSGIGVMFGRYDYIRLHKDDRDKEKIKDVV